MWFGLQRKLQAAPMRSKGSHAHCNQRMYDTRNSQPYTEDLMTRAALVYPVSAKPYTCVKMVQTMQSMKLGSIGEIQTIHS